jgi:hypothetical protein
MLGKVLIHRVAWSVDTRWDIVSPVEMQSMERVGGTCEKWTKIAGR